MTFTGAAVLVVAMAALWALQMYLAYRQARAFMAQVRQLRTRGRTAVGVSSHSRMRRRTYVALAADADDRVVDAIELSGLTVFARPRPAVALRGRRLTDLQTDDRARLARAAAMAAASLLSARADDRRIHDLPDQAPHDHAVEEVSSTG